MSCIGKNLYLQNSVLAEMTAGYFNAQESAYRQLPNWAVLISEDEKLMISKIGKQSFRWLSPPWLSSVMLFPFKLHISPHPSHGLHKGQLSPLVSEIPS